MISDPRLLEVFRIEYEATRNVDQAVMAVVTAVKAHAPDDEISVAAAALPTAMNVTLTVVHRYIQRDAWEMTTARVRQVIALSAQEVGVDPARLFGRRLRTRMPLHARGRWIAAALLRRMHMGYIAIGKKLGIDHSTVMYGLRHVAEDPALAAVVDRLWGVLVGDGDGSDFGVAEVA